MTKVGLFYRNHLFLVHIVGGQAKTLMFVQLNPDVESFLETISTLKFAERVSGVELGAARSNKEGRGVRELMEQVLLFFWDSFLSLISLHDISFRVSYKRLHLFCSGDNVGD